MMRDLINIVTESGMSKGELSMTKHNGAYLTTLIKIATTQGQVETNPEKLSKYGNHIVLSPETLKALSTAVGGAPLPDKPTFIIDGQQVQGSWADIYKSSQFTGLEAKKIYNTGHLAELFMGLAVSAKFFNLGRPVTVQNIIDMFGYAKLTNHINPKTIKETSNLRFEISREIQYPTKGKNDQLTFVAVTPGKTANEFIKYFNAKKFPDDIRSVLASAVIYVNEAAGVAGACQQVMKDPNSNQIVITSDGTSDSKGTKADLILSIDGSPVNLLSLKTYSTPTLGQMSGVEFDTLVRWFDTSFDLDIGKYKKDLTDKNLSKDQVIQKIFQLYDQVIYPQVQAQVENQKSGKEAEIVRRLARSANLHARGDKLEDVEVVKLDDKLTSGSYKILRFSDDLYDAMKMLDLHVNYNSGAKGRTIQILVKPAEEIAHGQHWANLLCQFRSQIMGNYLRNYFEIGDVMVELTQINKDAPATNSRKKRTQSTAPERARRT